MPEVKVAADKADTWVRVDDANLYGRGGLLPMSVFLTQNAPGLGTSPVKGGYWVVRRVLGETIPPPPAVVPELPHDEAKLDLPLREVLAKHRENQSCASCHARFDSCAWPLKGTAQSAKGARTIWPDIRSTRMPTFPAAAKERILRASRNTF